MSTLFATSQEIQITNIQLKDNQVIVNYNLIDERIDHSYSIHLYTSKDNFIQPVEMVKGDVGVDIPVGANKKIIWKAKEELGNDFSGGLKLEVKGQVYVPFIEMEGIVENMVLKRGKSNDLIWAGGRGDNILNVELYNEERIITSFGELPNTGKTSLTIPTNVKPGTKYRYKISDKRNRDEVVFSPYFGVARKVPLGIKLGSGITLSVAGFFIIKSLIPVKEADIVEAPPAPNR